MVKEIKLIMVEYELVGKLIGTFFVGVFIGMAIPYLTERGRG